VSPRGRRASLPGDGPKTSRGLLHGQEARITVRCFDEQERTPKDYDFAGLPVAEELRRGLAEAFARRTAPGAGLTSLESFDKPYFAAVRFARYLATLPWPPARAADLAPEHLDGFYESRSGLQSGAAELGTLKRLLARADGLSDVMAGKVHEAGPPIIRGDPRSSYSRDELRRIAEAARGDLRAAAARIRACREELRGVRSGDLNPGEDCHLARRYELLDWADRFADVPRTPPVRTGRTAGNRYQLPWVKEHGTVSEVVSRLHLTGDEAAAGAVLLAVLTGQNPGVILKVPAVHHRADGYAGPAGTAIVDLNKRRRGPRAHMSLALTEIPDWISIPGNPDDIPARDMLHTPFGVYLLLHELTARSRELAGGSRLLVGYSDRGGKGDQRGLRWIGEADSRIRRWAAQHGLMADEPDADGNPAPLRLTRGLIRLTYLELHQKPVAHTEQTLATDYLGRNRGNLAGYQKVVAATLKDEVAKARTRGSMALLTEDDLRRAQEAPEAVAGEHGVNTETLKRMISGELDTVMNACAGNRRSPHAPAGQPCPASFMLCLECPCARALPRHLPVQVLVHDRLAERRSQVTPLQWAQRLAAPHAQLADILARQGEAAVADARQSATDADRALVGRFLGRELDLR
jgi:hypothetical protein